ncbi:MAG: ABC transporter permease [Gammaproteobacteria bacterium]|nr:ABC transporter permease [Gammaproteobacteria bacterium]NIR85013.1 ABC transporter permease [Gammaproteobacteria bacterium]NIR88280.1 ABC transporter permease [Gammaproteobacteria bacterium]NIU06060.1 ABC transporter permease [Gammaproteobacteria bacterium]NIV73479.1 ABC transporter permease subunit [Gammaproteobacteria bacterium]
MSNWIYPALSLAVVVIAWHFSVVLFAIPEYLLPTPESVLTRLIEDFGFLLQHAGVTFYETMGGFLLSIAIGIPLAVALVWSPVLEKAIMPLLIVSQTFPKIAIAPLIIIWFGLGVFPKLLISFLVAFFPVLISAVAGMRSVDTDMIDLARSMQATPLRLFWKIRMPFALPHIFSGLKVAVAFAIVGAVVGEWVGANSGLGYLLLWANANLDTTLLFSILILLMVIGIALYYSVVFVERLLIPWHVSVREETPQATM